MPPLRILLCHFPTALDRVPDGRWHLILSGPPARAARSCCRTASGSCCSRIPRAPYANGVYRRGTTTMHVSPGLGTTFVPFRFFARPEATELVLRSGA